MDLQLQLLARPSVPVQAQDHRLVSLLHLPTPLIPIPTRKPPVRLNRQRVPPREMLCIPVPDDICAMLPALALHLGRGRHVRSPRPLVLDHHPVRHFVHHAQGGDEVVLGVGGGDAEADARLDERRGREADDDDGELAHDALARERRDLGRVVEHHGNHRAVLVAQHLAPHPLQPCTEEVGVALEVLDLLAALARAVLARNHAQREACLLHGGGRHRASVDGPWRAAAQKLDDLLRCRNVAANGPERLGEGAHHDVNVLGRHARVLEDATPVLPERPNAVRLVHVQIRLVLFAHLDNLLEAANLPLHAVQPLHHHQDLSPRPVRARLPLCDRAAQPVLQADRAVVLEHLNASSTPARADHDRRVVELIAQDQPACSHQRRKHGRVRCKPHTEDNRSWLPNEFSHALLQFLMSVRRPKL
mmetsp:Transcript_16757/g.33535  ORF Transcript_16757/g.33535 Transcript_16757/m.33535 type:complete len:418 (+) Transcript_16757:562-1815(+)